MGTIEVVLGDITRQNVDAVVTAANESLMSGPCEPGKAIATPAFDLAPIKHVIHTVGPVWEGGDHGEDEVLSSCYIESLLLAEDLGVESIAFPAIATGVHGFPVERAAEIAAMTIRSLAIIDEITLVAPDQETHDALVEHLRKPVEERCPTCDAKAIPSAPICWSATTREAAARGLVHLGPYHSDDDPRWQCTADEDHNWTNGGRDQRRHQVALIEAYAITHGEDRGWSVP